jgi:hypothetical protein
LIAPAQNVGSRRYSAASATRTYNAKNEPASRKRLPEHHGVHVEVFGQGCLARPGHHMFGVAAHVGLELLRKRVRQELLLA